MPRDIRKKMSFKNRRDLRSLWQWLINTGKSCRREVSVNVDSVLDSIGLGLGQRSHISNKFPGEADGLEVTFEEPLVWICLLDFPTEGFPSGTMVKNPPASAGGSRDTGSISGSERSPWYRKWQPAPVFLPIKFHGKRSLAGYNLWGCKELDTKKWLSTHRNTHTAKNHLQMWSWGTLPLPLWAKWSPSWFTAFISSFGIEARSNSPREAVHLEWQRGRSWLNIQFPRLFLWIFVCSRTRVESRNQH